MILTRSVYLHSQAFHIDWKRIGQWSNSIHLVKDMCGFAATVRIPWGAKVEYKFLVDGQWQTSDAPTETDPSGKYTNNVYTAPPKPASAVSSAISYVASGISGAFQNLTGSDDTEKVCRFSSIWYKQTCSRRAKVPAEMSTKDVALAENLMKPLSEVPSVPEVAPVVPTKLIPPGILSNGPDQCAPEPEYAVTSAVPEPEPIVTPTISDPEKIATSASAEADQVTTPAAAEQHIITQGTEPAVASPAPELDAHALPKQAIPDSLGPEKAVIWKPEPVPAPVVPGLEVSTHAPVVFSSKESKAGSLENGINGNGMPVPSAQSAPAAIDDMAETPDVPLNTTEPSPAAPESSSTLREGRHAFPGSEMDIGDGLSSKAGSSSMRKKRYSLFGGGSEVDDSNASKSSSARKKNRSFFGKVKHLFDKND